jgi:Dyp-type peroxidase family
LKCRGWLRSKAARAALHRRKPLRHLPLLPSSDYLDRGIGDSSRFDKNQNQNEKDRFFRLTTSFFAKPTAAKKFAGLASDGLFKTDRLVWPFTSGNSTMPVTLNAPFAWKSANAADLAMLKSLQPNILKAHTREFLTVLFVRFDDAAAARTALRTIAQTLMKSALTHLQEVEAFHANDTPGTSYVGVGLTAKGYDMLGIPAAKKPADPSFRQGMQSAGLDDSDPSTWDEPFRKDVHAVVLVGDQLKTPRDAMLAKVEAVLRANPRTEVNPQEGHGLHNRNGEGIEHFGYVDGRSQPIFLTEDVNAERLQQDGARNWDPKFGPGRAIVPDPTGADPASQFGSYFIYRKLEQNVRQFKNEENKLAARLGLTGSDVERAGAMIVGRFEDGTPLAVQSADGSHSPVPNDFTYDSDSEGGKCPFFAHIRKVNPRSSGGFEPAAGERMHIMVRRGQTYGVRTDDPNDGRIKNKPKKDVGLLFMAFNANIAQQFEFAQKTWANNAGFPKVPAGRGSPGLDMVIGQGPRPNIDGSKVWGADFAVAAQHKEVAPLPQTVTMKGGEYFFMPSLPTLTSL